MKPTHEPNIQKLAFIDDSELVFNNALGWYDVEKNAIEGIDILGSHDTVPLARVQRVELAAMYDSVETTLLIVAILAIGVVGGAYMFGALLGP